MIRYAIRGACALVVGLAVLLASVPALAHGPDPMLGGGLYAQSKVLTYRWSAAGTPPAAMKTALNAAADDSNDSKRSKAPTFDYDAGASNLIYYGADVPCGTNGIACMRRDPPGWFGVWFRANGTRFDWGTLRWCELSGSPDGCYELENVMLDELGHVLVLDHHVNFSDSSDFGDAVVQTYSRTKPRAGWNAHLYGRCDTATLQQQYDVTSWTTPYSTCFDVPSSMTLSASARTVPSGSMVTFTASLTSEGTGRLANNPVAGRTVVLQRRTSTTWTDVLTMSGGATAGTYVGSVTIRASADYRATFRSPSNEGINGSSSSAIPITMTATCTGGPCPNVVPAGPQR